jgi:hypothetical protein
MDLHREKRLSLVVVRDPQDGPALTRERRKRQAMFKNVHACELR